MRLSELEKALKEAHIQDARAEARLLFCHVTGTPAHKLPGCDPESNDERLPEALARRIKREPLAYILGQVSFYRETYTVTPDVLIPRSDTEILVEHAIKLLPTGAHFADFCTGSGCIAISVLAARPDCRATAYDISAAALKIARENAEKNGVADKIDFVCADLLSVPPALDGISAVLSNPPYIADAEMANLAPELAFEPENALRAPQEGFLFYQTFLSCYSPKSGIKSPPHFFFLFEIGHTQFPRLSQMAFEQGYTSACFPDLEGRDRVVLCRPILADLL